MTAPQEALDLAAEWDAYLARLTENPPTGAVWVENRDGSGVLVYPGETSEDVKYAYGLNTRATLLNMRDLDFINLLRAAVVGTLFPSSENRIREILKFHGLPAPESPPWWSFPSI